MSTGPLRRLVGTLGLLALVPTAAMLMLGAITVSDAAVRGGVTLVAVVVLGRVAGWALSFLAGEFDRVTDGAAGGRRASDRRAPAPGRDGGGFATAGAEDRR